MNRIEDLLKEILCEYPDICKCEKCRFDMIAMAANRLKPQYIVSKQGQVFAKANALSQQSQADVLTEVIKAVEKVSKNPRH